MSNLRSDLYFNFISVDVYTTIRQHLDNKELAIFCGAGISVPSGIPAVGGLTGQDQDIIIDGIVTEILKDLSIDENDIKTFFNAGIPFESFMGSLIENGLQLEKIIDIFDAEPCYYHDTIAQLIADGLLLKVATTNFDLCLEKAFLAATGRKLPVFRQVKRFAGNFYRMGLINNYARQAVVFLEKGQFDKSLALFDQAAGICIESNYIPGLWRIYANKGSLLAHHMNDKPAGIALLEKAIDIAKKLKSGQLQQLYAMLDEIVE